MYSVIGYGAKPDALWSTTGTCVTTGGGTTIITSTPFFTSTAVDAGKVIGLAGCGAAGATLSTTIVSVNSTTSAVITTGASTAVAGTSTFLMGTKNEVAIQAAMNAAATAGGGTVFFPCTGTGTYLIENTSLSVPWRVSLNGCSFEGYPLPTTGISQTLALGATILVAGPLVNGPIVTATFASNGGPVVTGSKTQQASQFTNIIFHGNNGMQTADTHGVVYIANIAGFLANNTAYLYGFGPGLYLDHDIDINVSNSTAISNLGAGFYSSQSVNSTMNNISCGLNGNGGILFDTAVQSMFFNIQCYNNTNAAGITVDNGYAVSIENSQIDNANVDGIDLIAMNNSTVTGNTITHSHGSGLVVGTAGNTSSDNVIVGNTIGDQNPGGIRAQTGITVGANSNNNRFSGNSCVNNATAAVTQSATGTGGNEWIGNDGCGLLTILGASGHLLVSGIAPSIASGFGTSPSIAVNNGTASFTVNVGTGGTASAGVITMPAANTGWACTVNPNGAPQAAAVTYSAPTSTTSITLTNYTLTTGVTLAWTTGTVLQVSCYGN